MKTINIYPAGGVQKGNDDAGKISWTEEDMNTFRKKIEPVNVHFIDPRFRNDNLNDSVAVFGRDLMAVRISDFVVVDARQKRGIGVGQEMLFAKMNKVPVITVAPKNGHYQKGNVNILGQDVNNFVHPFLFCTSDAIVENFVQAAEWIKGFLEKPGAVKDISITEKAIKQYTDKYMADDDTLSRVIKNG
jgi:hypothetical protein